MPAIRNSYYCTSEYDLGFDGASAPPPRHKGSKNSSHDHDKKAEHIRRPRNAFIIFRSWYVKDVKARLNTAAGSAIQQQNQLSQLAGIAWKAMNDEERQIYVNQALEEKKRHKSEYPDYVYAPLGVGVKTGKKGKAALRRKTSKHAGPNQDTANETKFKVDEKKREVQKGKDIRVDRQSLHALGPTDWRAHPGMISLDMERLDMDAQLEGAHQLQDFSVNTWCRMLYDDLPPTTDLETDCRVSQVAASSGPDVIFCDSTFPKLDDSFQEQIGDGLNCVPTSIPDLPQFENLGHLNPPFTLHHGQAHDEGLLPPFQTPVQLLQCDFETVLAYDLGLACVGNAYGQSGVAVENGQEWDLNTGVGYF